MKKIFFKDLSFDLTREWALLRAKIKRYLELNWNELVTYEEQGDYIVISTFWYFTDLEKRVLDYSSYIFDKYKDSKKIIIYWQLVGTSKNISSLPYVYKFIWVNKEAEFEKIFWTKIQFSDILSSQINHNEIVYPDQDRIISINLTQKIITPCSYEKKYTQDRKSSSKALKDVLDEFKFIVNRWYYKILLMWDDVFWYWNDIWYTFDELYNKMCEINWYYSLIVDYANISNVIKFFPKIKDNFNKIKFIFMPSKSLNNKVLESLNLDYKENDIVNLIKQMRETSDKISIKNFLFYRIPWETYDDFKYNINYTNLYDMTYFWQYDKTYKDNEIEKKEKLIEKLRKNYIDSYRWKKDFIDSFE